MWVSFIILLRPLFLYKHLTNLNDLDLSGPMRQGVHDFLIAVHLKTHSAARQSTSYEYIIPLNADLYNKDVFDPETENRYPHVLGPSACILPIMKAESIRQK